MSKTFSLFDGTFDLNTLIGGNRAVFGTDSKIKGSDYDNMAKAQLSTLLNQDVYTAERNYAQFSDPLAYKKNQIYATEKARNKALEAYEEEMTRLSQYPMLPPKARVETATQHALDVYEKELSYMALDYPESTNLGAFLKDRDPKTAIFNSSLSAKAKGGKDFEKKYRELKAKTKALENSDKGVKGNIDTTE